MSGAELMLLGAGVGAATDKQNPMRGAILGGAMGGVLMPSGMIGPASQAYSAGAGGIIGPGQGINLIPQAPSAIGNLATSRLAARGAQSAVSGGLLNSIANSNNPLTNQAMQSLLNPMGGGGGGNQQIVQSGTGIQQGSMNQSEGEDPVGQFLQAKVVKQPKRSLISVQTDEDDDRYLIV